MKINKLFLLLLMSASVGTVVGMDEQQVGTGTGMENDQENNDKDNAGFDKWGDTDFTIQNPTKTTTPGASGKPTTYVRYTDKRRVTSQSDNPNNSNSSTNSNTKTTLSDNPNNSSSSTNSNTKTALLIGSIALAGSAAAYLAWNARYYWEKWFA